MLKNIVLTSALTIGMLSPLTNYAISSKCNSSMHLSDKQITTKVNALFNKSPLVKSKDIKVNTIDKIVFLKGKVETDGQFIRAVSLANSVCNVANVDADNLAVSASDTPISDSLITAKIKGIFLKEQMFKSKQISHWPVKIETKDGKVFLTGKVSNAGIRDELVELAKEVKGVKFVKSAIVLES